MMTKRATTIPHHTTQVNTIPKLNPGGGTPNMIEMAAIMKKSNAGARKRN
jgi:hypothetical protein